MPRPTGPDPITPMDGSRFTGTDLLSAPQRPALECPDERAVRAFLSSWQRGGNDLGSDVAHTAQAPNSRSLIPQSVDTTTDPFAFSTRCRDRLSRYVGEIRDLNGMGDHCHVARWNLNSGCAHALREHALGVGRDGLVVGGDQVPRRKALPGRNPHNVVE